MALLEAMSYRLPVVMTPQCNFDEAAEAGAGVLVEATTSSIAEGLAYMFSMTDGQRKKMGTAGYELVSTRFTWDRIVDQLLAVYRWMLGEQEPPLSVVFE